MTHRGVRSPIRSQGLVTARTLVDRFQSIVRRKAVADLDPWLCESEPSLVASFAPGISKDLAAVRAAVTKPWSNGQTEGHVNRLRLVERQMYGLPVRWRYRARLYAAKLDRIDVLVNDAGQTTAFPIGWASARKRLHSNRVSRPHR